MPNTILTPDIMAQEVLYQLEENLVAANLFARGYTDDFTGAKVGDTIQVRVNTDLGFADEFSGTATTTDLTQTQVPIVLEKHFYKRVAITSREATLDLESFSEQVAQPCALSLARGVERYALGKAAFIPNWVGTAADPPDSWAEVVAVNTKLNTLLAPMSDRYAVVNPAAEGDLLTLDQFHAADKRGDGGRALIEASMGRVMKLDWYMSQLVASHTNGTLTSPVVNGAVAAGAVSMNVDGGAGTETLKAGTLFTVAGVTGQFVVLPVTNDQGSVTYTASGGAITGVRFYPAAPTGGFANDAAITVIASHVKNFAVSKPTMVLAIVPLELPMGGATGTYIGDRNLGIRMVQDWDANAKSNVIDFDLLVGAKVLRPDAGVVILG